MIFLLLPMVLTVVCILCTFKLAYNKIIENNPILFICYPRSVGLNRTETRCALKCKLISGCEYEEYIEK